MTNKEIIMTLDNVANALMQMEFKGSYARNVVEIFRAFANIQEELSNRKDDE